MYKNDKLSVSCDLNISGPTVDCNTVTKMLCDCGIVSHVQSNNSIRCETINNKRTCWIENGCTITYNAKTKTETILPWKVLKNDTLKCAHLSIKGIYNGCILNWEKESLCE